MRRNKQMYTKRKFYQKTAPKITPTLNRRSATTQKITQHHNSQLHPHIFSRSIQRDANWLEMIEMLKIEGLRVKDLGKGGVLVVHGWEKRETCSLLCFAMPRRERITVADMYVDATMVIVRLAEEGGARSVFIDGCGLPWGPGWCLMVAAMMLMGLLWKSWLLEARMEEEAATTRMNILQKNWELAAFCSIISCFRWNLIICVHADMRRWLWYLVTFVWHGACNQIQFGTLLRVEPNPISFVTNVFDSVKTFKQYCNNHSFNWWSVLS